MFICAVFFVLGFMSPSLSLISISILSHMSISCKPSHCIWLLYIVLYILINIYIYIYILIVVDLMLYLFLYLSSSSILHLIS